MARRADFLRVQGSPFRVTTPSYVLLVAARLEPEGATLPARLGLTVGKKVGRAPERNRVKRVFRECFRTWPTPGLVPAGFDLVVIARRSAVELGLVAAQAELGRVARLLARRCQEAREALTTARAEEARVTLARAPTTPHVPGAR